jgi:hypothetical protein
LVELAVPVIPRIVVLSPKVYWTFDPGPVALAAGVSATPTFNDTVVEIVSSFSVNGTAPGKAPGSTVP